MKISELSRHSGVSLPTIKFYIREGLLPPGTRTGRNQAAYGASHVSRLTLIRSLRDAAGLPLDVIARSLRAADRATDDRVIAAIDALERPAGVAVDPDSAEYRKAVGVVQRIARSRGWSVGPRDVSFRDAARALAVTKRWFPYGEGEDGVAHYFEAAESIAKNEIPEEWDPGSTEEALAYSMLGTVLFEPVILAARRMAHVARIRALDEKRTKKATKTTKTKTKRRSSCGP
jgi:DNA-binding transcriptional MerR regulator